jgi:hypothetical protein
MKRLIFFMVSIICLASCQQSNQDKPEKDDTNITVYISNGVYHRADCSLLGAAYTSSTISDAEKNGITECSSCKPKSITQGSGDLSVAVQCRGYTKKGARCKNMTKNSNGYCYLHGGN